MNDPVQGDWEYVPEVSIPGVKHVYDLDVGNGSAIRKTVFLGDDVLCDENAAERAANAGKRWGDGQVIGRVPLPLYFSTGLAEANRQRDKTFIRRFWNDLDHKKLRTFEGRI